MMQIARRVILQSLWEGKPLAEARVTHPSRVHSPSAPETRDRGARGSSRRNFAVRTRTAG